MGEDEKQTKGSKGGLALVEPTISISHWGLHRDNEIVQQVNRIKALEPKLEPLPWPTYRGIGDLKRYTE